MWMSHGLRFGPFGEYVLNLTLGSYGFIIYSMDKSIRCGLYIKFVM
jgi:hypothetical protein